MDTIPGGIEPTEISLLNSIEKQYLGEIEIDLANQSEEDKQEFYSSQVDVDLSLEFTECERCIQGSGKAPGHTGSHLKSRRSSRARSSRN